MKKSKFSEEQIVRTLEEAKLLGVRELARAFLGVRELARALLREEAIARKEGAGSSREEAVA